MRRLAAALGVKAPSLYQHVPDEAALEALVVAAGFAALAAALAAAADGGAGRLAAIAAAYRAYALAHPPGADLDEAWRAGLAAFTPRSP